MQDPFAPEFNYNLDTINEVIKENNKLDYMYAESGNLIVESEDDAKHALSIALQSRKILKTIEESRKKIIAPHVDFQKAINTLVKDVKDKLDYIQNNLEEKIGCWMTGNSDDPFRNVSKITVEDGSIYLTESWEFEVQDINKLPREYLTPDESMIKKSIKDGIRNIPGVLVIRKESFQMKVKN